MRSLSLNPAQQGLFAGNQELIERAINRYRRRVKLEDRDDFRQQALIALTNAAITYREGETPFEAYGWKCIANACKNFLIRRPQPSSHDDVVGSDEETGEPVTRLDRLEKRKAREGLLYGLLADEDYRWDAVIEAIETSDALTRIERRALKLRFLYEDRRQMDPDVGLPLREVARRLKRSTPAVHKTLQSGIRKLSLHLREKKRPRLKTTTS